MKIVIAYDGTLNSQIALKYGLSRAKTGTDQVLVMHVFPVNKFIDYGAGPGAEEIARADSARFVQDAKDILKEQASGLKAEVIVRDGVPEYEIAEYAREVNAGWIIAPPGLKSLAKNASCQVSIIPAHILVPVDNTESVLASMGLIMEEASLTASRVILLGIIPVHLYSIWERKELDSLKKETSAVLKKAAKMLEGNGIEVREVIRSGYPDEEIIKASNEYPICSIIIPGASGTPSELGKAASIIMDDTEGFRKAVILAPSF